MRLALSAVLLMLPLAAAAQVYTWKDSGGKVHYSDQPPPDKPAQTRKLGPQFNPEGEISSARKTAAEKRLDSAKQEKASQEAAAKSAQEKAASAEREKACERARTNLQGLESGLTRFRINAAGEREALDGDVRDAELAESRRAVDNLCSSQPAASSAAAPQPAAAGGKKAAPGY